MALRDDILAGSLKLNTDIFSLNPSAVISLFIIDISDIAFNLQIPNQQDLIFRFHNNIRLTTSEILFNTSKTFDTNGRDVLDVYVAAPIKAEGFEYSGRGTLPTPKLSMTVQENGLTLLTSLKRQIYTIGDLAGAKVTRIRTLAKYLHPDNFVTGNAPDNNENDPYAEFQREVFYIERKSAENKSFLEYELVSILDLQGVQLPGRRVSSTRCVWQYRGAGCMYEQEYRQNNPTAETVHGKLAPSYDLTLNLIQLSPPDEIISGLDFSYGKTVQAYLPSAAPPVATENDELIKDILGFTDQSEIVTIGKYDPNYNYLKGHAVFLERAGIKYYYVCKTNGPTTAPPNTTDWIADRCSRRPAGCRCRWGPGGAAVYSDVLQGLGYTKNYLPFGGYPAVQRQ